MKRKLITIAIILLGVTLISWATQEKTYTVKLPLKEWEVVLNQIDSKQVSNLLITQINEQLKAEQDTVKKK